MKLREVIQNLQQAVEKDPSLLDEEAFYTDDQCAHFEISGRVYKTEVAKWPAEYCIEDCVDGPTFVRIC